MTKQCDRFEMALVSDDPAERTAAREHARQCARCQAVLAADELLAAQVTEWKSNPSAPPTSLKGRIAAAVDKELDSKKVDLSPRRPWMWAAAAAIAIALGAVTYSVWTDRPDNGEMISAVRDLDRLQHQYARAIAVLESKAEPVLARAADHELDARKASILMSYRDRLTHLDGVIAEVQGFLADQPGHSGAHKVLLAAYREKDELLRKILHIPEDSNGKVKGL